ncbi:hypothetical protein CEXT_118861, partial [Caerostris extrusa]
ALPPDLPRDTNNNPEQRAVVFPLTGFIKGRQSLL